MRCISHVASRMRGPKLALSLLAVGQERLWISTCPLLSINPRISSPGMGWQHCGKIYMPMVRSDMTQGIFLLKFLSATSSSLLTGCVGPSFFLRPMKGTNFFHPDTVEDFFSLRVSKSLSLRITVFFPKATKKFSCVSISWSAHNFLMMSGDGCRSLSLSHCLKISSPVVCCSRLSLRRIAWIFERALAVETKLIHEGCTCCELDDKTSTWSPLCSLWLRGTSR